MSKPALKASQTGLQAARLALTATGWTQKDLMVQVGCSRQPLTNFFKGGAVAQPIFSTICEKLGLDWQAVADLPKAVPNVHQPQVNGLETLVLNLRQQLWEPIQERCGTMRILDMSHPIGVEDIYTSVNILEQISGRRRKKIDELLQNYRLEEFDRLGFGQATEVRLPGLEAVAQHHKLIILGKPGAGKTTFLKHLALQCNQGNFGTGLFPLFVTLKDFADSADQPSLLDYLCEQFAVQPIEPDGSALRQGIQQGRALLLLDGLDEVAASERQRLLKEIRDFSEQFRDNRFVITCRIAAWEYTFEKFTEVEIADFDRSQISAFAARWFQSKPISAKAFLRCLEKQSRIFQLAVSPLLLTLLCLAFEESGEFPLSRSELYKEGIDALLKKWDAKRGIQRDQVYYGLSLQRKTDLLGQIALETFRSSDYLFKQSWVEQMIADYIRKLPQASTDPEALQLDSEAVLRSIEAQHGLLVERAKGIYSFSHLTFHEYFATRELIFNELNLEIALTALMVHLIDRRWHEVFLLAAEMLRDSSLLLLPMQRTINSFLADDPTLQQMLAEVEVDARAPEFSFCRPAAVRAFLFDIDFDIDKQRRVALLLDPAANILICASFLTRILADTTLKQAIAIAQNYDAAAPDQPIVTAPSADAVMLIAIQIALASQKLETDQGQQLTAMLEQLDDPADAEEVEHLADAAREVAKARHHIGRPKRFNQREKELLCRYYYANQLLLSCLNSALVTPELRQQIETSLLLPQSGEIRSL